VQEENVAKMIGMTLSDGDFLVDNKLLQTKLHVLLCSPVPEWPVHSIWTSLTTQLSV